MKRIPLFLFIISCTLTRTYADEGMWLPMLLNETVMHDMQNEGFKLSADDIYSVNHGSMKDGVLLFGSGCTGEVISPDGLVLTNYHCGRGLINSHSTLEHNYLEDGFWARSRDEELRNQLTVTFIVRMEDVTGQVLHGVTDSMDESQQLRLMEANSRMIAHRAADGTGYQAVVRPFFYGNQYILIVSQTFMDVRLVGAPPESMGDFGGDADNWIFPRHSADFSLFRIYAGPDNQPAAFSPGNKPYKPPFYFSISLQGEKENDFVMVYGFPGRTTEYVPSYAVDLTQNVIDPDRVLIRDARLGIWWNGMQQNDTVRLQYLSKYYRLSNGWKKWQGEILGLERSDAVKKKRTEEAEFESRLADNTQWNARYGHLLPQLKQGYDSLRKYQPLLDYYSEALKAPELFSVATSLNALNDAALSPPSGDSIKAVIEKIKTHLQGFYARYNAALDKQVTASMIQLFNEKIGSTRLPTSLQQAFDKGKMNGETFAKQLFDKSFLDDSQQVFTLLAHFKKGDLKKLQRDPAFIYGNEINAYYKQQVLTPWEKWDDAVYALQHDYMKAQMEVFPERKFYPDANLTLRVAYGKVKGYQPRDGVSYSYFTTSEGILQKYKPHDEYYDAPPQLISLLREKNFGRYADGDGTLHTCFITTAHTTGGNSGSPVIDANGHLIGINFDRCWEGTMSDLYYDPSLCRNIAVDIRYTLYVIDKYAGAGYLLNEMKIID